MPRSKKIPVEPSIFYAKQAGRVLKGLRYERNLNTSDLATLCGWKSEEMIHRIERGERSLEVGDFFAICEYAGLTLGEACARFIQACEYQDGLDYEEEEEPAPKPAKISVRAKPKAKAKPKAPPAKREKPPAPERPFISC